MAYEVGLAYLAGQREIDHIMLAHGHAGSGHGHGRDPGRGNTRKSQEESIREVSETSKFEPTKKPATAEPADDPSKGAPNRQSSATSSAGTKGALGHISAGVGSATGKGDRKMSIAQSETSFARETERVFKLVRREHEDNVDAMVKALDQIQHADPPTILQFKTRQSTTLMLMKQQVTGVTTSPQLSPLT